MQKRVRKLVYTVKSPNMRHSKQSVKIIFRWLNVNFSCQQPFSTPCRHKMKTFLSSRPLHTLIDKDEFNDYELHRRKMADFKAPEYYNFARDMVDRWAVAEKNGQRGTTPAFWWVDDAGNELKWSFQNVAHLSRKAANVLTFACSLHPGDTLIVILPRVPPWWVINIAAIRAGIISSSGTTLLMPKDIIHRLKSSKCKCIIADSSTVDKIEQVADQCESLKTKVFIGKKSDTRDGWLNFDELMEKASDEFQTINSKGSDPMTLFFTSGTTGDPKMTEHTHASYGYGHLLTGKYFLNCRQNDVVLALADTGWAKCAWSCLFAPWIRGSCIFVHHSDKFDPKKTINILQKYPVSHFCAPPTAYRLMVNEPLHDYKIQTRHCLGAGEPVNPELLDEWKEGTGLTLYEGFGQTETTFLCGTYPCIDIRSGSMGKASPGIDIEIVDDNGNILPHGSEGNVGIRCFPHRPVGLFSRYVDDENRTNSVFQGDFYLTGDRAIMDDDKYIWFVGRADDVILTAGYRVGPFEVESALQEHPSVLESAAVSSPDKERGEVVKAFVVLTSGYENSDKENLIQELKDHVKSETAPYKYPRKIEFIDQLPKTVSGKIRRVELRGKEWGKPVEHDDAEI